MALGIDWLKNIDRWNPLRTRREVQASTKTLVLRHLTKSLHGLLMKVTRYDETMDILIIFEID